MLIYVNLYVDILNPEFLIPLIQISYRYQFCRCTGKNSRWWEKYSFFFARAKKIEIFSFLDDFCRRNNVCENFHVHLIVTRLIIQWLLLCCTCCHLINNNTIFPQGRNSAPLKNIWTKTISLLKNWFLLEYYISAALKEPGGDL